MPSVTVTTTATNLYSLINTAAGDSSVTANAEYAKKLGYVQMQAPAGNTGKIHFSNSSALVAGTDGTADINKGFQLTAGQVAVYGTGHLPDGIKSLYLRSQSGSVELIYDIFQA